MSKPRAQGRRPRWGPRLAAPPHHLYWPTSWEKNRAGIAGRGRCFPSKQRRCRWSVSGPDSPVHGLVAVVEGDEKPWFLVTAALDLSAAQVVAALAARFRQEDGCRAHPQRLGMEECRAWTKEPVLRTFPVQMIALTRLRRLPNRLDPVWGTGSWWCKPAWNGRKRQASIRDLCRRFWRHRAIFSHRLVALEDMETIPQLPLADSNCTPRAA